MRGLGLSQIAGSGAVVKDHRPALLPYPLEGLEGTARDDDHDERGHDQNHPDCCRSELQPNDPVPGWASVTITSEVRNQSSRGGRHTEDNPEASAPRRPRRVGCEPQCQECLGGHRKACHDRTRPEYDGPLRPWPVDKFGGIHIPSLSVNGNHSIVHPIAGWGSNGRAFRTRRLDLRIGLVTGDAEKSPWLEPLPEGRFLEVLNVEGADQPLPHGGRVQILSVERYDTRVSVVWRLAPRPDPPEEHWLAVSAFERGTVGLSDDERILARVQPPNSLVSPGAWGIALSDDLGTDYQSRGGGGHGGRNEWIGRTDFVPALPEGASALTVYWSALMFPVLMA